MTNDGERQPEELTASVREVTVRRQLDRQLILTEALAFLDEHGRQRLTMRRLGARLGVEAMALYRYLPGREQLLDGVVNLVMQEIYDDTLQSTSSNTWSEYIERVAYGVRRVATNHPKVFPLIATRPPAAPWLRPPLRSLKWVEGFLKGLIEHGFSKEDAVTVYRSFATFLLGHLLLETSTLGGDVGLPTEGEETAESDLADYPLLVELAPELSDFDYSGEFEESLEDLLNRFSLFLA